MSTKKRIKTITFLFALFCASMGLAISFSLNSANNAYAYTANEYENIYNWTVSGLTISADSDVYYEGSSSLKIVDTTVAGESHAELSAGDRFKVESGKVYETSVWFCSQNCSADASFKLHLYLYEYDESGNFVNKKDSNGNPIKYTKLTGTTYALNAGENISQWQKAVTRLEIPALTAEGNTYYAAYYLETSGGYANVWVDLFSCFVVEDENDVIIEYDDFSAFSSEQKTSLGDYSKTQQIGEWQLESEKTPSNNTSNISHIENYTTTANGTAKYNAIGLTAYKNQGYAYVTKKVSSLFEGDVYTLSGHYRTSDNALYTYAGIKFYDYYGNEISAYEKSIKLDYSGTSFTKNGEEFFSLTFTAPSNLYAKIYLGTEGYSGNNESFVFYFRDIKISLVGEENMLSDISGMIFNTIEYEIQNEVAKKGYALKMRLNDNAHHSTESYVIIPGNGIKIQKNKEYVLSYWFKITDTDNGNFNARVYFDKYYYQCENTTCKNTQDTNETCEECGGTGFVKKQYLKDYYLTDDSGKTDCDWTYAERRFSFDDNVTISQVMFKNFGTGETTVYLDEVRLTTADGNAITQNEWNKAMNVGSVTAENNVAVCDETFSFDMTFSLTDCVKSEFTPRAEIIDENGEKVTTVVLSCSNRVTDWTTENINDCTFLFTVPYWLPSGSYSLRFDKEQMTLTYGSKTDNVVLDFTVGSSAADKTVAEVKTVNGEPILYINGEAKSPMMYSYSSSSYAFLTDVDDKLYSSGLDLFVTFEGNLAGDANNKNPLWQEDGTLDYDTFDKQIERALSDGNGYAMINISIYAPNWWTEKYPDECAKTSDGDDVFSKLKQASFSSELFREQAGEQVKKLVEHMKTKSYYKRIFGIKLSSGRTGEWMNYGNNHTNDVSSVALTAFKNWAKKKYETIDALNTAWNNTTYSDFSDIEFPDLAKTSDFGIALNPATQRAVIDYYTFINDVVAEDFVYYAEIVKDVTNDEKIVGGYFGYSWFSASYGGIGTEHLAMEKVLLSDAVDFVASPISYSSRLLGRSSQFMAANDTVRAYGKLYLLEQDNRTAAIRKYSGAWEATDYSIGRTHTIKDSVYELKRDFANDFINGNAFWYYDMFGGWFDDSQIYAFMNDAKQEYDYSLNESVTDNAEVALFISNSLYSYGVDSTDNTTYAVYNSLIRSQKDNLSAMGAPYDVYKTESLVSGKVRAHKVNIILSAFELTAAERKAITSQLKKNNQYVVFVYACGLSDGTTASAANMSSLTGFNIRYTTTINCNLQTKITADSGIAEGLNGVCFGNVSVKNIIRPYVIDADLSEKFGVYSSDTSMCSLAKRNMGTWTSIFSGGVNLPAALLRNILKEAGVHIYSESDNDIIYANSNYVALHSGVSENKTIKLNGNYAVYDVFAKRYVSFNTNTIEYYHVAKDTKVFRLSEAGIFKVTKITDDTTITEKATSENYTLPDITVKDGVFLGWLYNGELCFAGTQLTLSGDIIIEAVVVDFYVADGADLRLDETYPGIRFHTYISDSDKEYLQSVFGSDVVFGTRITSSDMAGYLDVAAASDKWFAEKGYSEYRTVLTGFESDVAYFNYGFAAQGYVTVTLNGETRTFYTSPSKRKIIAEMALRAYADRFATKTEEYCNYVAEERIPAVCSGYSKFDDETLGILYYFAKYAKDEYFINIGDLDKWIWSAGSEND